MTKSPSNQRSPRRKQDGRPKGTVKRFQFEETKLGFFLKYEVPVVFDIIMNMTPPGPFKEPPYLLIKIICGNSNDESFSKPKYERYMKEYKLVGLCCKHAKKLTPERKVYYETIRKKKLEKYILSNKTQIIESLKRNQNR